MHNSIIEPLELLKELAAIETEIVKGRLPFEPKPQNLLFLEKMVQIKSYHKNNQIIFLIEIPIVEKEYYSYYHLYPMPIPKDQSFQVVVPKYPYLILNDQNYMLFNSECQEIYSSNFICYDIFTAQMQESFLHQERR